MESTGREHCIHVSQETAAILTSLGKGYWVHPREDKIHAKGKGELQTYWIKPNGFGQCLVDHSSNDDSEWNSADVENTNNVEELVAKARKGLNMSDRSNDIPTPVVPSEATPNDQPLPTIPPTLEEKHPPLE